MKTFTYGTIALSIPNSIFMGTRCGEEYDSIRVSPNRYGKAKDVLKVVETLETALDTLVGMEMYETIADRMGYIVRVFH